MRKNLFEDIFIIQKVSLRTFNEIILLKILELN